jgi:hypothetical protein
VKWYQSPETESILSTVSTSTPGSDTRTQWRTIVHSPSWVVVTSAGTASGTVTSTYRVFAGGHVAAESDAPPLPAGRSAIPSATAASPIAMTGVAFPAQVPARNHALGMWISPPVHSLQEQEQHAAHDREGV